MKRSSARASKRRARRPKKDAIAEQHRWKLSLLREFVAKHGWAKLSKKTIVPPGVRLFNFVRARRVDYADGEIADWLVQECEAIPGWSWSPVQDAYRRNLDNVRRLVRQHGWAWLRTKPIVDGVRLDRWVAHRRSEYNRGTIERWLIPALEALPGWTWKPRIDSQAKLLFALRGHVARHGWASIDQDTMSRNKLPIGHWSQN